MTVGQKLQSLMRCMTQEGIDPREVTKAFNAALRKELTPHNLAELLEEHIRKDDYWQRQCDG